MNTYTTILQYFFKRHWLLLILLSLWLLLATILFSWVTSLIALRESVVGLMKLLPPIIQAKIGRDLSMLLDPTGSLTLSLEHPLLALPLAIWTMLIPLRHLASDQERGLLDMLLAKPVSRFMWLISVLTFLMGGLIVLTLVISTGYFVGRHIFIELSHINLILLFNIILMQSIWAFLIGSITGLFASIFGRFRVSLGLGLGFVLVMFFMGTHL